MASSSDDSYSYSNDDSNRLKRTERNANFEMPRHSVMPIINPRFSRTSQQSRSEPLKTREGQTVSRSDTLFTIGCEEYRVFKKHGFTHQGMESLNAIPTENGWAEHQSVQFVESDEEARSFKAISRLSSQETLAPRESESRHKSQSSLEAISLEAEIEKGISSKEISGDLGKTRPEVFETTWKEVIFVICILASLSMAEFVISGFQVLLPALIEPLNIPQASRTWPSSVLTLVLGSFLFPMGRLADMYGGYLLYSVGMAWFITWTIIAGFSQTFNMLVVCRAMAGLGAAAFLPAGITLIGRIYRPGPRKNMVFSIYGALSPVGFFSGIVTGGFANDVLSWKWYFWIGGMLASVFYAGVVLIAPKDYSDAKKLKIKMDWLGICTMIPGFMLVVYAIQDSSRAPQGWGSPRIVICLLIGIAFLCSAVYVEGWVAEAPLIPGDIFQIRFMKRMLIVLFLTWGVFSIYLFYANFYIQEVLHKAPLLAALCFAPWAIGGVFLAAISGFILHLIPSSVLLFVSGCASLTAVLLFALMPENPSYWAWILPAMLAQATCADVMWIVSNVFLTTSLPKHRQGLAGALTNVTVYLGSAFFLALADVAAGIYEGLGWKGKRHYQGIFFFGVGLAGLSLVLCLFIPLGKATSAPEPDAVEPALEVSTRKSEGGHSDTVICGESLDQEDVKIPANELGKEYAVKTKRACPSFPPQAENLSTEPTHGLSCLDARGVAA